MLGTEKFEDLRWAAAGFSPRRLVGAALRKAARNALVLECEMALDRLRSAVRGSRATDGDPEFDHLLIATVGGGNVGDQAMVEAFLRNVPGSVTIVVENGESHSIPAEHQERVRLLVLPGVFHDRPDVHFRGFSVLLAAIVGHAHVSVIGADIMDGGYDSRESVLRFSALTAANRLGVPTRVLGFSWNGRPQAVVERAMRRTQPATKLFVRDPHSATRIRQMDPPVRCIDAADGVFALDWDRRAAESDGAGRRRSVVVNASGLVGLRDDLLEAYADTIICLVEAGYHVTLLPHVFRAGDDDLAACREVAHRVARRGDYKLDLVDRQLSPFEVAALVSGASAVVSGRMHLAIIALKAGVPAAVLSTQGKVSGMLSLFGLEEFAIEVDGAFGERFRKTVERLVQTPQLSDSIAARLEQVEQMAKLNYRF